MTLSLARDPRTRLVFLCLLYLAQGLPFGFVTVALAAHLAAHGADAASIGGVIAMAMLPWSFKWAWGPVVDSGRCAAFGRRRPWIMIAQAAMISTSLLLAAVPAGNVALLGWIVLLHNVFVGLQDVAVDALAVDMLHGADRERASGMMYGTSYLGTFLGGAGLGVVVARFGLPAGIAVLAGAEAFVLAAVIACRERPGDRLLPGLGPPAPTPPVPRHASPGAVQIARRLFTAMTAPDALRAAVAAIAVKILPAALAVLMTVHLIEKLGWSQERFSVVTGGVGILLGLVASVVGGFFAGRVGPWTTAILANAMLGVAWLAFACVAHAWNRSDVVVAWVAADTICQAITTVSLFAVFMRVSSPVVAATQFTASMALMNLATSLGAALAGPIGRAVDPPTAFLIAGLVQPFVGLLLPRLGCPDDATTADSITDAGDIRCSP